MAPWRIHRFCIQTTFPHISEWIGGGLQWWWDWVTVSWRCHVTSVTWQECHLSGIAHPQIRSFASSAGPLNICGVNIIDSLNHSITRIARLFLFLDFSTFSAILAQKSFYIEQWVTICSSMMPMAEGNCRHLALFRFTCSKCLLQKKNRLQLWQMQGK